MNRRNVSRFGKRREFSDSYFGLLVFGWKGIIQDKFFALHSNVGINLKRIFTKFEVFTNSRFQDIAVQNLQFCLCFSATILSVFWQKINF